MNKIDNYHQLLLIKHSLFIIFLFILLWFLFITFVFRSELSDDKDDLPDSSLQMTQDV